MKKISLIIIVLLLSMVYSVIAADVHNRPPTYTTEGSRPSTGDAVLYLEDELHIVYIWRFTYIDSTDAVHSPPLFMGGANIQNGRITAKQSATGDANIIMHYAADDRNTWEIITPASLDATSSTLKSDTLGHNAGSDDLIFHAARWMIVESVGGSSTNQDGNIMTIVISLPKLYPTLNANGTISRSAAVSKKYLTAP